jgi:hypothetical protein
MKNAKARVFATRLCVALSTMSVACAAHAHSSCDRGGDSPLMALVLVMSGLLGVALACLAKRPTRGRA